MARSQTFHTTNGTTQEWDIDFSGGYISKEHVYAYFYPTGNLEDARTPVTFTWVSSTRIRVSPALATGGKLLIQRETPVDDVLVTFTNTADFTRENLNVLGRQAVFATAEMIDTYEDPALLGAISDAKAAADAALVYRDAAVAASGDATASKVAAASHASTAASQAVAAASSAESASSYATSAGASRTEALTYSNNAATSAASASNSATAASTAKTQAEAARDATVSVAMPSGAVMAFARTTAPTGWLKCDGTAVSRSTYAALFAEVGTAFGAGDGSSTFNLPDLRGEFIRGFDDGRGIDAGRAFASVQSSDNKAHDHMVFADADSGGNYTTGTNYAGRWVPGNDNNIRTNQIGVNTPPSIGLTSQSGGSESRPRNVALLYCIKT